MLEVEKLLVDHDGDTACGENLEYDTLLLEVREAIEGRPEQQIGEDNVIEAEEPDWKLVKKNCLKLCAETHNLEVVVSLSQAMLHLEGFSGFAESSSLLAGVVEKYWDCIHPQLDPDDNDPIERLNMLAVYEDFKFLLDLQKIELISSKGVGSVSLYDIRRSKSSADIDGNDVVDAQLIGAIFKSSTEEQKESLHSWLDQSIDSYNRISTLLTEQEHIGSANAPTFTELLKILNEAKSAVAEYLDYPLESDEDSETGVVSTESGAAVVMAKPKGINNRNDVISAIQDIEDYYYKHEPGSPIPLLLQRARNLVDKDFISMMEDLAPDSTHQLGVILGNNQS